MLVLVFLIPNFDKAALVSNKIDKEFEDSFTKPCIYIYGEKVENTNSTKLVKYLQYNFNRSNDPILIPEQSTVFITDEFPDFINFTVLKLDSMKRHLDVLLVGHDNTSTKLYSEVHEKFQQILIDDNKSHDRLNHIFVVNCDDTQSFLQIPTGRQLLGSGEFLLIKYQKLPKIKKNSFEIER